MKNCKLSTTTKLFTTSHKSYKISSTTKTRTAAKLQNSCKTASSETLCTLSDCKANSKETTQSCLSSINIYKLSWMKVSGTCCSNRWPVNPASCEMYIIRKFKKISSRLKLFVNLLNSF